MLPVHFVEPTSPIDPARRVVPDWLGARAAEELERRQGGLREGVGGESQPRQGFAAVGLLVLASGVGGLAKRTGSGCSGPATFPAGSQHCSQVPHAVD